MTIEEVTTRAGGDWAASTLGRWENGDRRIRPTDLRALLDVYEVGGSERDELLALAREAREQGWWQRYRDVLPTEYSDYIGLETEATAVSTYQQQLIPGLMQTRDYARAIIRATRPDDAEESIDRRLEVRLDRQHILTQDPPAQVWAVIDEACLRRSVGSATTMRDQLNHLALLGERPRVTLQVVRFAAGAHAALASSFSILDFPTPDTPVCYIDTGQGGLFVETAPEVEAYRMMFDHVRAAAASPTESAALLREAAQAFA